MIPLGIGFIIFTYLVINGASNAVNLTDGLDGLAIMPTVLVACGLGVFAYASGNAVFSSYLQIPQVPGAGELVIICAAIAGAGLGFLWFNTYPAMVFMGDIGALALGAVLGTMAVIVRQELVLVIMGGIFVIEINDNPNIDTGVEDLRLKDELYKIVVREFIRRLDGRTNGEAGRG